MEGKKDYLGGRKPTADDFVKVRENTGLNRKEFAEYLQIPYRTVQEWELGRRQAPIYIYNLIREKMERDISKVEPEQGRTSVINKLQKMKEGSTEKAVKSEVRIGRRESPDR